MHILYCWTLDTILYGMHCAIFHIFPQKFACCSVVILKPIGTDSQNPRTLRPDIYLNRQRHSLKLQVRLVLMLISVVTRCTVKNVGAITWKSDWQICYCGEVNKFWLGFDEIEEVPIHEKSPSGPAVFKNPFGRNDHSYFTYVYLSSTPIGSLSCVWD